MIKHEFDTEEKSILTRLEKFEKCFRVFWNRSKIFCDECRDKIRSNGCITGNGYWWDGEEWIDDNYCEKRNHLND